MVSLFFSSLRELFCSVSWMIRAFKLDDSSRRTLISAWLSYSSASSLPPFTLLFAFWKAYCLACSISSWCVFFRSAQRFMQRSSVICTSCENSYEFGSFLKTRFRQVFAVWISCSSASIVLSFSSINLFDCCSSLSLLTKRSLSLVSFLRARL